MSALLLPLNANAANNGLGADSSLLQTTDVVKEYAQNIVNPRLNHIPSEDRLLQFLEVINVLLDPKDGIASSGLSVPDFMSLAQKSGQQIVSPDSELLDELPDNKRESNGKSRRKKIIFPF